MLEKEAEIKRKDGLMWFICKCGHKLCQVDNQAVVMGVRMKCAKCREIVLLKKN